MSLVRTLAKVAVGVAAARAVKGMVGGGRTGPARASTGGGLEDLLGQVLGQSGMRGSAPGGGTLEDMLGKVLGGRAGPAAGPRDGSLGAQLDKLSRLSRPGGSAPVSPSNQSFGEKLDQSLDRFGEPDEPPSEREEELAGVMLRAMIQAAKADGRIDDAEKRKLHDRLGDVSEEDLAFVNAELARDLDPKDLAASVPKGAEGQVYMLSAMAMELDDNSEARYLHALAGHLRIDSRTVNEIHDRLGIPRLYR
jgi:uncharacterized membrane protein YebE (DUF533 family)